MTRVLFRLSIDYRMSSQRSEYVLLVSVGSALLRKGNTDIVSLGPKPYRFAADSCGWIAV